MPLLNFNEQEPGLFFKARDGSLFKVGPTAVGELAPNSGANGFAGNTVGEMWLDTSGLVPMLKVYDGVQWTPSSDPGGVSSVGLTMPPSLFSVGGTPITSAGVLDVSLQPQVRNRVLAGPLNGGADEPTFRALAGEDIPGLDGSKIVSGFVDQARIPSLDASKITSGVFNTARIPGIDATKIISGVLPYQFGGTGVSDFPQSGEILIGGLSNGWRKNTLQAGTGIGITNGAGTIQLKVAPLGPAGSVQFNNGGALGGSSSFTFDGSSDTLTVTGTTILRNNVHLAISSAGASTPVRFSPVTGGDISVVAPPSTISAYTLSLPETLPASPLVDHVLVSSTTGVTSFESDLTLERVTAREYVRIEDSFNNRHVELRAPSLGGDLTLTLPASFGGGGMVQAASDGTLSVTDQPSFGVITSGSLNIRGGSPTRETRYLSGGVEVSSDGTYSLIEWPLNGFVTSIEANVVAYNADETAGSGLYTATYSLHFNGSTAALSTPYGVVDSWAGADQPTFAADVSASYLRLRVTTSSGSDTIKFSVSYTVSAFDPD